MATSTSGELTSFCLVANSSQPVIFFLQLEVISLLILNFYILKTVISSRKNVILSSLQTGTLCTQKTGTSYLLKTQAPTFVLKMAIYTSGWMTTFFCLVANSSQPLIFSLQVISLLGRVTASAGGTITSHPHFFHSFLFYLKGRYHNRFSTLKWLEKC